MFTVGQSFSAPNNPGRIYTVTGMNDSAISFSVTDEETGSLVSYADYSVWSAETYVRDGYLVPLGPVEPMTKDRYLSSKKLDDAFNASLASVLYDISEKLARTGKMTWDDFERVASADHAPFNAPYIGCVASDHSRLPEPVRDANKSADGIVYGIPVRSLNDDTDFHTYGRDGARYQPIKLGKLLKACYPTWADHVIASVVDSFKARYCTDMDFAIVSGDDIRAWYHEDMIHPDRSNYSLDSSCMRYSSCQSYFGIYTENPKRVSLAIATMGGMLIGRMLVWRGDDGSIYFDRSYGQDDTCAALVSWAMAQYPNERIRLRDHGDDAPDVTLSNWDFSRYPYMDTYKYLSLPDGTLSSYDDGWRRILNDTCGSYEEYGEPTPCDHCGEGVSDGDGYWDGSGHYCYSCWEDTVRCDRCSNRFEPDSDDQTSCGYCREIVTCAICGTDYHPEQIVNHYRYSAGHPVNGPWLPIAGPPPPAEYWDTFYAAIGHDYNAYRAAFDAVHYEFVTVRNHANNQGRGYTY